MKKLLLGKSINIVDIPAPGISSKEVLVEVAYSFVSSGTELAGVKSASSSVIDKVKSNPERIKRVLEMVKVNGVKKTFYKVKNKLEMRKTLGYSCSGRIIAKGSEVIDVAVGDYVACGGQGYASHGEVVAVPINLVSKVPDKCDLKSASGAVVASIALQGVRQGESKIGETVAIIGLGLLGQITAQLLEASGVNVIGFDLNEQRVKEIQELGFDNCFSASGEKAMSELMARTNGMGADIVMITASSDFSGICQTAIEMCRKKGRVVVVGDIPLEFDRSPFYRKEIEFRISCSYGPGRYDSNYEENGNDYPYAYVRWTEKRNISAVLQLISQNKLDMKKMISAEYNIDDAKEAFASLSRDNRPLAIVLKYDFPEENVFSEKIKSSVEVELPNKSNGKIGVGVIGVGQFCQSTHLSNLHLLNNKYQIVGVCDKNSSLAQEIARQHKAFKAYADVDGFINDENIDLVVITTRHDTHAEFVMKALKAGKHVIVEKPLAMNNEELNALEEIARSTGKYVMVGFNRRFSPHIVRLQKMLTKRVSPIVVNYRVIADAVPSDSWIYSPSGGGRVIGEACHMIDLLNHLVGSEYEPVEVKTISVPSGYAGPPGDNFCVSIKYKDGSICVLTYSTLGKKSKLNGKERIEVMWDGKTYVVDDYSESFGTNVGILKKNSKGHFEELETLADYLNGKASIPISLEDSVKATRMSFLVNDECKNSQAY